MKSKWMAVLGMWLLAAQAGAEEPKVLDTKMDRVSYGIGVDFAKDLKRQGIEVQVETLARGLKDGLGGETPLHSETDLQAAMTVFHLELGWREARPKGAPPIVAYGMGLDAGRWLKLYGIQADAGLVTRGLKDSLSGEKLLLAEEDLPVALAALQLQMKQNHPKISRVKRDNKRSSETVFLAANSAKEGVVSLPSGLQYKVLQAAEGRKPGDADTVTVHYRGSFIQGTEFASSYRAGEPATFRVAGAVPGWREALKLMPAGSRWRIFIPSSLAFRPRGWGLSGWPTLPLISELELLSIQ